MNLSIFSLTLFAASISFANSNTIHNFSFKNPYNLLTPGYDIVTEDDLAYDNHRRTIGPYDPVASLSQLYWQCFSPSEVKAGFEAWVGPDGMGAHDAVHTMCTIEISVRSNGELQIFTDRRAHQIGFCLDFVKEWKWLTKDQKIVCLDGEGGAFFDENKQLGRHKLWTWDKFKTKKGCYSFFAYDCNTSGCDQGKGLCRPKP
jgi:hypothetical protein